MVLSSWTNSSRDDEIVIKKYTYDGFVDTPLDAILRRLNIRTLVVAGVDSDVCVRDTAAHGFALGYTPVLVRDAVASDSEIAQAGVLQSFGEHYGHVVSSAERPGCVEVDVTRSECASDPPSPEGAGTMVTGAGFRRSNALARLDVSPDVGTGPQYRS